MFFSDVLIRFKFAKGRGKYLQMSGSIENLANLPDNRSVRIQNKYFRNFFSREKKRKIIYVSCVVVVVLMPERSPVRKLYGLIFNNHFKLRHCGFEVDVTKISSVLNYW
jgi:hypothetical protein